MRQVGTPARPSVSGNVSGSVFFLLRSARFLLSIAVSGRQAGILVDAFGSWELVA